jgi:hypothetical protein
MDIKYEFTDKEITPWGRIYLMKKFIEKMRLDSILELLPFPNIFFCF